MRPKLLSGALFVLAAMLAGIVHAQDRAGGRVERLVVFGDSLSDPGNAFVLTHRISLPPYDLIPDAPYARGGLHFSNGATWVEQLARRLPGYQGGCAALRAPRACGNYAVGAARARTVGQHDLTTQVVGFLGDARGAANTESLYVVHAGGNDIRDAIEALLVDPSGVTSTNIIGDAVEAIGNSIVMLASAGAEQFLVPNAPNLALAPAVRLQGPQAQAAAQAMSVAFNQALAGALVKLEATFPLTIVRLDVFALINDTVAAPVAAGLTEVEAPCIVPGVVAHAECRHPDQYLFWDGIHPTRAGHAILARKAAGLLWPD